MREPMSITLNGETYEFGVEGGWMSVSDYMRKHKVPYTTLKNRIDIGTVPPDCYVTIPHLNGIAMIRDRPYPSRKYVKKVRL